MSTLVRINSTIPKKIPPVVADLAGNDDITGGRGGWESLNRPRRAAAAGWVGTPPKNRTIPLIFDGMEAIGVGIDLVVESMCAALERLAAPHPATGQPPIVTITGDLLLTNRGLWVIQDLEWGAAVRNANDRRIQQEVTVTLLEYRDPVLIKSPAKKAKDKKKAKTGGGRVKFPGKGKK